MVDAITRFSKSANVTGYKKNDRACIAIRENTW
jgi:hypothetical protein